MIDEQYIKTAELPIQELLFTTLYNISFLLKDRAGNITDAEAKYVFNNLDVSPTGTLPGLETSVVLDKDYLLGMESFSPVLSRHAFYLYKELSKPSSSYVIKSSIMHENVLSDLLDTAELPQEIAGYMSYVYLELYSLLRSLVDFRAGNIMTKTMSEMESLYYNTRYVSAKIALTGNDVEAYKLLNVLKHVQRSILFVKRGISTILR